MKRKKDSKAEKGKGVDDDEAPPAKKPRKKAPASKVPWKETRGWLEPWVFQEELIATYRVNFPEHVQEITLALELIAHQGWFNIMKEQIPASLKQVHEFYRYFRDIVPLLPNNPFVQSQFLWDGAEQFLHTCDLARVLGIEPPPSDSLKIHQKRNWVEGGEIIVGLFGEKLAKERRKKDKWFVIDLPVHLRIVHAFIVTNITPRSTALDRVNPADGEILWEVKNRRRVDTAQIVLFGMQCSTENTREKLVMPHLIHPILKYLGLSHEMEDPVDIGTVLLPQDLENIIYHGNLAYVPPPPPPEKVLKLEGAPPPKKGDSQEIPTGSQTSRPGLRSGDAIHTNQSLDALNDKMAVMVGTMSEMRDDLKRLGNFFREFVVCFKEFIPLLISEKDDSKKSEAETKDEDVDANAEDRQHEDPSS